MKREHRVIQREHRRNTGGTQEERRGNTGGIKGEHRGNTGGEYRMNTRGT